MSTNNYTITGRLGRDPELRFSQNGLAIAKLNVAVSRRKKVGDDWQEETVWMSVAAFGPLAENAAESLTKGDEIIAVGFVEEPRVYEKKDGTQGVELPFVANELGASLRWKTLGAAPKRPAAYNSEPF